MIMIKTLQAIILTSLVVLFSFSANAESTCHKLVKQLGNKKTIIDLNNGMWGYFEKTPKLKTQAVEAIQLDSRINKIFYILDYLCNTEKGIPLNDLATYISSNLSIKSEDEFKNELNLIGKTPIEIESWFRFHKYAQQKKFRTLDFLKIRRTINQTIPIINKYILIAMAISQGGTPEKTIKDVLILKSKIDELFVQQPYFVQAFIEIAHVPYWDTNESTGGS